MHKIIRLVLLTVSLSLVVACSEPSGYVVVRHSAQTTASSGDEATPGIIDPWSAEAAAKVVVPPIEAGPARVVGGILMLNTAFLRHVPDARYEVRGDIDGIPNVRWASGPAVDDSDGDGWLEFDLVAAKPGVYDLTFMSISRRKGDASQYATDVVEVWAHFGSAERARIGVQGKKFLHCSNEEYYKKCAVRIAIDAKRVVTPAAGVTTSRALALEAAAAEAKAKALAAKIAAETPPQELGIVEDPIGGIEDVEILETPAISETPADAEPTNMSFTLEETVVTADEPVAPKPRAAKHKKRHSKRQKR